MFHSTGILSQGLPGQLEHPHFFPPAISRPKFGYNMCRSGAGISSILYFCFSSDHT
jgi:hypothetical protein